MDRPDCRYCHAPAATCLSQYRVGKRHCCGMCKWVGAEYAHQDQPQGEPE